MAETQIYSIVNSVNSQAYGASAVTVVNEQGLIALGNTVLSSSANTEPFLNALSERIGKTIVAFRKYKNMFGDLMRDDMEYGNIVQKIAIAMPAAERDESYNLTNGVAVDMYKVRKPTVTQKLFTSETPYEYVVTIQRVHLKNAFTSAAAMEIFINGIFGEMQNALELSIENLGRNAVNNMLAETHGTSRAVNLAQLFYDETGTEVTQANAKHNADFMRFVVAKIKATSNKMRAMSVLYNDGSKPRFTPVEMQKLYVLSDYETALETVVQYAAFHDNFVSLDNYKTVPYWQAAQTPEEIKIKRASDGTSKNITHIVACLFDRDAVGTYKTDEWSATTPVNAAGGYYNVFYHERDIWFNDLQENFVMFYIGTVTKS